MGQATTISAGAFSITARDGDWDGCCFSSTRPDLVLEVRTAQDGHAALRLLCSVRLLHTPLHPPFCPSCWACPSAAC
jgi:hypothetical protein